MAIGIEKLNWEKIKSFFWNAIVGAILIIIVGFSWLGWVLESTAQLEAKQSAKKSVNDRLAKICVYQFGKDPEKDLKLKELKGKSSWNRVDYLKNQGWATMPVEEEPDQSYQHFSIFNYVRNIFLTQYKYRLPAESLDILKDSDKFKIPKILKFLNNSLKKWKISYHYI